jgi:hypothetical protein
VTTQILFFVIVEALAFLVLFKLVTSKKLLEKYTIFWLIALVTSIIAFLVVLVNPDLVQILGFKVGSNLLIFGSIVLLSGLCLQLSTELSRQEKRIERLASSVALLQLEVRDEIKKSNVSDEI